MKYSTEASVIYGLSHWIYNWNIEKVFKKTIRFVYTQCVQCAVWPCNAFPRKLIKKNKIEFQRSKVDGITVIAISSFSRCQINVVFFVFFYFISWLFFHFPCPFLCQCNIHISFNNKIATKKKWRKREEVCRIDIHCHCHDWTQEYTIHDLYKTIRK